MPLKKTHKRKKYSRMHGRNMGTAGHGSRKQHRSSGNRGGKGMAGTGKRADHKKTLILKLYGNKYFGKQGVTSRGTQKDKTNKINVRSIQTNLNNLVKKGIAKETSKGFEINLEKYVILGDGEIKEKLIIKAMKASKSAIEKVQKAGGEIILPAKKVKKKEEKGEVKEKE